MNTETNNNINYWLTDVFDTPTREKVQNLIDTDSELLEECFYKALDFGTGGMRGKMGVGTNRINKYTIGLATQGLANYIKQNCAGELSVAIAYDSRNNSPFFAQIAADILSANGIHAHLFSELRPTPVLSFAVRELRCNAGIVITASHNPKEYNGYKVYWDDGAQIVAPHDQKIISEVRKTSIDQIKFSANTALIHSISEDLDLNYRSRVNELVDSSFSEVKNDLKIVFTSLHGTGITMVPDVLKEAGYDQVILEPEQAKPSGDFYTVDSPNPEEASALANAINLAKAENADLVLGTDPDADRVGIVARNNAGEMVLLNGNQACSLIVYYRLELLKEKNEIPKNGFISKTIVTSDLISRMAEYYGVNLYETLTGFKFIAAVMREKSEEVFLGGGEESYGYLVGDFVRDKDAVISSLMLSECAAWAKSQGKTLLDILDDIYLKFGHYRERLISVKREGISGAEEIKTMMDKFRNHPPTEIAGSTVVEISDYLKLEKREISSGLVTKINLPESNVMQFTLENGLKFTARPSGTEPKIKFYFSVNKAVSAQEELAQQEAEMNLMIEAVVKDLNL